MRITHTLLLAFFAQVPVHAAEPSVPARPLIVAAVGEIPVARLKMTEVMGRTGYEADESSTPLLFPQTWEFKAGAVTSKVEIGLNLEPAVIEIPRNHEGISLKPFESNPPTSQVKPKPVPAAGVEGPTMLIIHNRNPDKPWLDGFSSVFTTCQPMNPAKPSAVIINLSGATLSYTGSDRTAHRISPGASAVAPIFIHQERSIRMLPLTAAAGGKTYPLDVCPIDTSGNYSPVVVVYPSITQPRKFRPLQVSVLQPSRAISPEKPAQVAATAAPAN
ncbi:MAG: hypothetical protein EOP87_22615 [Verrucomicrobiaceae bacterium]|nr:MAG: hypothetical protein EOP87_22615 [Verrucomicrobiaceae bacterium]